MLKRGYNRMIAGRHVLVVDDVVNTGESIAETIAAVRACGGDVSTAAALCTRGNAAVEDLGCREFVYLTEVRIPSWPARLCDLCRRGIPVNTEYAHGADFVSSQGRTP